MKAAWRAPFSYVREHILRVVNLQAQSCAACLRVLYWSLPVRIISSSRSRDWLDERPGGADCGNTCRTENGKSLSRITLPACRRHQVPLGAARLDTPRERNHRARVFLERARIFSGNEAQQEGRLSVPRRQRSSSYGCRACACRSSSSPGSRQRSSTRPRKQPLNVRAVHRLSPGHRDVH